MKANIPVFNQNSHSNDGASRYKLELRRVGRAVTTHEHTQKAVLVSCQSVGLMTIETHSYIKRHCSITARGLMDTLARQPVMPIP